MRERAMRSGAAFPAAAAAALPAAHKKAPTPPPVRATLPSRMVHVFSHDMTWHADVDPCVDTPDHEIQYRSFLRALTNKKQQDHARLRGGTGSLGAAQ